MINFFKKSKKLPQLHDKTPKKFEIQTPSNVVDFPDVPKDKVDVRYPLLEPYAYAHIKWDNESGELVYSLEEPHLEVYEKKVLNLLEEGIKELWKTVYYTISKPATQTIKKESIKIIKTWTKNWQKERAQEIWKWIPCTIQKATKIKTNEKGIKTIKTWTKDWQKGRIEKVRVRLPI